VGETLKKRLDQAAFESPVQEAVLNLLVASGHVRVRLDRVCVDHGVTLGQYNVLRILKGVHPAGHARCEIARRMLERSPDVTRLIDRLERQGLVERGRSEDDRRLSVTRITRKGLRVLEEMQPGIQSAHREIAERLSADDARQLSRICESLYGEEP
jgi:DNA-binding MarR family transcriptional regulator